MMVPFRFGRAISAGERTRAPGAPTRHGYTYGGQAGVFGCDATSISTTGFNAGFNH